MKKVREILRRDAFGELPALAQLQMWLRFHAKDFAWLAERFDVSPGTLSSVVKGERTSAPLLERIATLTGIPADSWEKKPS